MQARPVSAQTKQVWACKRERHAVCSLCAGTGGAFPVAACWVFLASSSSCTSTGARRAARMRCDHACDAKRASDVTSGLPDAQIRRSTMAAGMLSTLCVASTCHQQSLCACKRHKGCSKITCSQQCCLVKLTGPSRRAERDSAILAALGAEAGKQQQRGGGVHAAGGCSQRGVRRAAGKQPGRAARLCRPGARELHHTGLRQLLRQCAPTQAEASAAWLAPSRSCLGVTFRRKEEHQAAFLERKALERRCAHRLQTRRRQAGEQAGSTAFLVTKHAGAGFTHFASVCLLQGACACG